ncbi:MAG: N-acetyl-gamma-glutamyl-phosphate reductase [Vulcanimicrobiaceae bacterium]
MTRVHVYGAAGYAAAEVLRLLRAHGAVELGALESRSHAGEPIGAHAPLLRTLPRRFDGEGAVLALAQRGECAILAGNSGAARELAPALLQRGVRVIDLSGDFRLQPSIGTYGFPERYRDAIAVAGLVANPGCYPVATLLATLPAVRIGGIAQIVVDAKSGITGAGRTPAVGSLFAEVAGEIRAYGLAGHRHEPEILQELRAVAAGVPLTFTPHVVPIVRGMLVDAYCIFGRVLSEERVAAAFAGEYAGNAFVRVLPPGEAPSIRAVVGTNDAEIAYSVHGNVVRSICAIDNLGKGAAGQAVQNLNIMYGYPEEMGFDARAIAG